jgi:hypothetical protein
MCDRDSLDRATRGTDFFIRVKRGLGFTLHRAPLVYQQ